MLTIATKLVPALLKIGAVAIIANEVRGIILAAPVLYALWISGGTAMAIWLAFCLLAGIAASVIVPMWAARLVKRRFAA